MEDLIRQLLENLGEDPAREGLLKTPKRVTDSFAYLTQGYGQTATEVIGDALFEAPDDEMIIVKDIEMYSLCEHHLLPFFGRCHVGYIPNGRIIGISKIPRVVEVFARRLQVQERLTKEIAQALMDALQPKGVAVVVEARHLCMMMRGVEKQNSAMHTSALLGAFRSKPETRAEFMSLISRSCAK